MLGAEVFGSFLHLQSLKITLISQKLFAKKFEIDHVFLFLLVESFMFYAF